MCASTLTHSRLGYANTSLFSAGQASFRRSELVYSRHLHQFMSAFITYLAEVGQSKEWPGDEGLLLPLAKSHLLSASRESLIGNLIGQGSLGTKLLIYVGNDSQ